MSQKHILFITACLLFIAIFSLPYGYYQLLRLIVTGVAAWTSWNFYKSNLSSWAIIFLFVAILFNPVVPVYLTKAAWVPLDFITACLFVLAANSVKGAKRT